MFERFTLIAGPCVLEDDDLNLEVGRELARLSRALELPVVFKASFDKANRSKLDSPRGPGAGQKATIHPQAGSLRDLSPHNIVKCRNRADKMGMPSLMLDDSVLIMDTNMSEGQSHRLGSGTAIVYSARCPGKTTPNEDAVASLSCGENRGILAVADGLGGQPAKAICDGQDAPVFATA